VRTIFTKAFLFLTLLMQFATAHAGGDDLVKTWKNKQEAYYNGETLVEKNSLEAIKRMNSLLKKYKWPKAKKISMMHKLADLHLNTGRILENKSGSQNVSSHTVKALKIYKDIITSYPKYSKLEYVLFSRGFELFMRRKFDEAQGTLALLNKNFSRSKFTDDAFVIRADSFYELKKFQSAANLYTSGERSSKPELAIYSKYRKSWSFYNLKKYNQAYSNLYALALSDKGKSSKSLYASGEALADLPMFYQKQNITNSYFKDFNQVAGAKKTEALLSELSDLYFDGGRWSKSISVNKDLINKYPQSKMRSVYHLKSGIALSTRKKIRSSSLEIKKGLELCKSKVCSSIAQDEIFKLVNDWEKHWRQKQNDKSYARALSVVYPSLAKNTIKKSEKSKIYLLLAEVEHHSKNYKKASLAFEQAYIENPKAVYAKQARWGAIESLMYIKTKGWAGKDVERLSSLVKLFISDYSAEKDSVLAQNFLAQVYNDSNRSKMAADLYRTVSEQHMYTETGKVAYNNYLKVQIKENKYETVADYLLNQKKLDTKGSKRTLINKDIDQVYTEWTEKLAASKKVSALVSVYDKALTNRSRSPLKKDWLWNKSLALASLKAYKKAAESFLSYEKEFGNTDNKRLEALNNALFSYKKSKKYDEALVVTGKLLRFDSKNRQDWLMESAKIHYDKRNYMTSFEVLSQVSVDHPQKNEVFNKLLSKFSKVELSKVTRSNLSSYSGNTVGELFLKLISKIDNLDAQETKSAALRLKSLKAEDSNYNAKGHYFLAIHEFRKFKKNKYTISSKPEKSLEKMIKRMIKIDGHFRDSIASATGTQQTRSIIGLGQLYLQVAGNYTAYSKKRLKSGLDITEVKDLISPFLGQSKVFWGEALNSLRGVRDKKEIAKLKKIIKKSKRRSDRLEDWYKKKTQVKLAKNGGSR